MINILDIKDQETLSIMDRVRNMVNKITFAPKSIVVTKDRFDLMEEIKLSNDKDFTIEMQNGVYKASYKNIPLVTSNKSSDMYVTNYLNTNFKSISVDIEPTSVSTKSDRKTSTNSNIDRIRSINNVLEYYDGCNATQVWIGEYTCVYIVSIIGSREKTIMYIQPSDKSVVFDSSALSQILEDCGILDIGISELDNFFKNIIYPSFGFHHPHRIMSKDFNEIEKNRLI